MPSSTHIPGIELREELGRGSYSVVYRAQLGETPCAVKLPLVRGRWTRGVYREAVALARVHHPGLAAVLEVGEAGDLPYLVMELVEGDTLDRRLSRGPLSDADAIGVVVQVVAALRAVHHMGLVHRDVKPRNIVLGRDGKARLIDFGFATPFDVIAPTGGWAGTRGYAAPEQLVPGGRPDGRADLYAVGRVLLECVVGRGPRLVGDTETPGPEAAGPRLAPILAGLLAEDPASRYPDAAALLRELEGVRQGRPAVGASACAAERRGPLLVGRSDVLARINKCWSDTGAGRRPVTLLLGTRGTGKSTLFQAAAAAARFSGEPRVLEAKCRENDPPMATIHRVMDAFVASFRQATATDRPTAAEVIQSALDERLWPFAHLILGRHLGSPAPDAVLAEAAPGGFAEGASELLVRLARAAGRVVLFVDDAQWLDPVSRDVIARLASRMQEPSLSLALASRPSAPDHASWLRIDPTKLALIELLPLGFSEISELVARHLAIPSADASLVRRVEALADGTPLGVMEVLGAFLDCGAVRPHREGWKFDEIRAAAVALPTGALAFLGHRLGELPHAARRVFEAAAVLGATFEASQLARVVGLELSDLQTALAEAVHTGFVSTEDRGRYRFVHDSVRDLLLEMLDPARRRSLHQRAAETLDDGCAMSFEVCCAAALHYGEGELERAPAAAYRVAREAATASLQRFDSETSLRFLEIARNAAAAGLLGLDAGFHRCSGEAELRLGMLDHSLGSFQTALGASHDPETSAVLLGRIAWVHQVRAEPARAWAALDRAFLSIGARMPGDSVASVARSVGARAKAEVGRRLMQPAALGVTARRRAELACDLHYQNARLGGEYGKPLPFVQSTLEALRLSENLGAGRSRARARAFFGLVLSTLGMRAAARKELGAAETLARSMRDPTTQAFCIQIRGMAACFSGQLDEALARLGECVDQYGPWLELNEYCLDAATAEHIESVRGRPDEARKWISRATERLRRSPTLTAGCAALIALRSRAAFASSGRASSEDPWTHQALLTPSAPGHSFYDDVAWGPRARLLTDMEAPSEEVEALVREFNARAYNPRSLHPTVAEYFIAIGHFRLRQCLRSPRAARVRHVEELRVAHRGLRTFARIPLYEAHFLFIQGCIAWLDGSAADARRFLGEAQALAEEETCPWVMSEVARVRAHMLREGGNEFAALSQARVAEMLARENGALPRALRICEEFALPAPQPELQAPSVRSSVQSSVHARRQLSTLLRAVQKSFAGMSPEQQTRSFLADFVNDLDADSGVLSFHAAADLGIPEPVVVAHGRHGAGSATPDAWLTDVLRRVSETGLPWPPTVDMTRDIAVAGAPRKCLVFPLFLQTRVVGAVCVERSAHQPPFSESDHDLLLLLSHQVPVALETSRLLSDRDQLQTQLVRAQRMEAVGELAGALAHDFNNTLAIVQGSIDSIAARGPVVADIVDEVEAIFAATQRAGVLTQQLLSFSKHQPAPPTICRAADIIRALRPALQALLRADITLTLDLPSDHPPICVEKSAFEQALVNLTMNARDAMPRGGSLLITTRALTLAAPRLPSNAGGRAGEHVSVEVTDTGCGMTEDILARAFEPYFTTKPRGTGLGLSRVYAVANNAGGEAELSSDVGKGTTVRLLFPALERAHPGDAPRLVPVRVQAPPASRARGRTILVVDDDPFVPRMVDRTLSFAQHHVLLASNASEATRVVERHAADIGLILLDVMMPGISGPELGRRLAVQCPHAKLLFISGFAPRSLAEDVSQPFEFLQKPFSQEQLLARVQQLLET